MSKLLLLLVLIGCKAGQNIEQLDTLEEGIADMSQSVRDIPKTVIRDVLDIEDVDNNQNSSENNSESIEEKVKKLEKKVKELEKEKDDASDDLEDISEKLECASQANGLKAVKECLQ